jgi:hypothetical protein
MVLKKLVPVVMAPSRINTVPVALVGAYVGSLAFRPCHLGDVALVAEINPIGAILGATVSLLLFGPYPFIRVFFSRI